MVCMVYDWTSIEYTQDVELPWWIFGSLGALYQSTPSPAGNYVGP